MLWPGSRSHARAVNTITVNQELLPPTIPGRVARGLRLAQAACVVGLAYAAVSVYWAVGGTWLLNTVGATLEQQGRAGNLGIFLAVWAAAVLKIIGAIVPLAAVGVTPQQTTTGRRRQMRVLAWLEAAILTIYGLVLTGAGLLLPSDWVAG